MYLFWLISIYLTTLYKALSHQVPDEEPTRAQNVLFLNELKKNWKAAYYSVVSPCETDLLV